MLIQIRRAHKETSHQGITLFVTIFVHSWHSYWQQRIRPKYKSGRIYFRNSGTKWLTLSIHGRRYSEVFCLIFPENRVWHFVRIIKAYFRETIINLSSAEFARRMVKVNSFTATGDDNRLLRAGLGGAVGCASDWRPGGRGFDPRRGRQHSFVEIDHEIFPTVILFLPLIQEGQLSVSGERMCTILVNRLED